MTNKKRRNLIARELRAHGAAWAASHKIARMVVVGDLPMRIVDAILENIGYSDYNSEYYTNPYDPHECGYNSRYHLKTGGYLCVDYLLSWWVENEDGTKLNF